MLLELVIEFLEVLDLVLASKVVKVNFDLSVGRTLFYLLVDVLQLFLLVSNDDDIEAFLSKLDGSSLAKASLAACDDGP